MIRRRPDNRRGEAGCLAGFRVTSDRPLVGLPEPAGASAPRRLKVRTVSAVELSRQAAGLPTARRLGVGHVGDFLVSAPDEILVAPAAWASAAQISAFLFGPCFSVLAYLSGLVPLHAALVETSAGTIAIGGRSGAGKSTLAAALAQGGGALASDDVCYLEREANGRVVAWPGVRRLRLNHDSAVALGHAEGPDRLAPGGKHNLALPPVGAGPRTLQSIYLLEPSGTDTSIARLTGARAAQRLVANIHRPGLAQELDAWKTTLPLCAALAGRTGVFVLRRPADLDQVGQTAGALLSHAQDRDAQDGDARDPELAAGRALLAARQWREARACFEAVLARQPDSLAALCALADLADDRAMPAIEIALTSLGPGEAPEARARRSLALARAAHLRRDLAAEARNLREALEAQPDHVRAHVELAKLSLLSGDFEAGWPAFEWRWREPGRAMPAALQEIPLWRGEPLEGDPILLHAEQGFGSTLQFARYAPLVAARGGMVTLEVPQSLVRLMPSLSGVQSVVATGEQPPAGRWRCPLMSLPAAFGTRVETIPGDAPYLFAHPDETARWSQRLPHEGLRVGLAWAGAPAHYNDARRSIAPELLAPLAASGAELVSLQKRAADHAAPPLPLLDLGPELSDFAVTAAVIANLDLVIAVDTSVAHLAGALGKPVWILLPFAGEYRWLLGRDDSPWYPTARLFRQPDPADWISVIEAVRRELRRMVEDAERC